MPNEATAVPQGVDRNDDINPITRQLMLMWEKKEIMKKIVQGIEKPDILRKNIKEQFI